MTKTLIVTHGHYDPDLHEFIEHEHRMGGWPHTHAPDGSLVIPDHSNYVPPKER